MAHSLQSFDTVLLEMPGDPIACASPSTPQVETPPIHASCMMATKACHIGLHDQLQHRFGDAEQ